MPLIGYLHFAKPEYTPNVPEFLQGLGERGFVEGNNVALEYRWTEGQYDRLPAMAAELVARKVDLIAASSRARREERYVDDSDRL